MVIVFYQEFNGQKGKGPLFEIEIDVMSVFILRFTLFQNSNFCPKNQVLTKPCRSTLFKKLPKNVAFGHFSPIFVLLKTDLSGNTVFGIFYEYLVHS